MNKHQKQVILDRIEDILNEDITRGWEIRAIYNRLNHEYGISLFGTNFIYEEVLNDDRFYWKDLHLFLKKKKKKDGGNIEGFLKILKDFLENPEKYNKDDIKNLLEMINRVDLKDITRKVLDSYEESFISSTNKGS